MKKGKASSFDRGGVRELSYDPINARPNGQSEEEIHQEARLQFNADRYGVRYKVRGHVIQRHVPKPDRYYLLRFLGLTDQADTLVLLQ